MKKVSVCIATYNGEKYINRQIESILSQLEIEDEIIISDDNSKDNTVSSVHEIDDCRIKIYFNEGKSGPVANFQNALMQAGGDYIFLADQDDVWLPSKVETMRRYLEEYDLVLSDCEVVDADMNVLIPSYFKLRSSKSGFMRNIYKNSFVGCCMAFKREVINYALPFPDQIHMHDWWIGLLVELKGRVHFVNVPLMKYVRHGENASPTAGESDYTIYERFKNRFLLIKQIAIRVLF